MHLGTKVKASLNGWLTPVWRVSHQLATNNVQGAETHSGCIYAWDNNTLCAYGGELISMKTCQLARVVNDDDDETVALCNEHRYFDYT
jgi:hypothetical protein